MSPQQRDQSQYADRDEVDRDDVVEQSRHHEDQDAGDERDERADRQGQVHGLLLVEGTPETTGPRMESTAGIKLPATPPGASPLPRPARARPCGLNPRRRRAWSRGCRWRA